MKRISKVMQILYKYKKGVDCEHLKGILFFPSRSRFQHLILKSVLNKKENDPEKLEKLSGKTLEKNCV